MPKVGQSAKRTTKKTTKKTATTARVVERVPSRLKYVVGGITLILASFGVSYFIGTSGSGQINVSATIMEGQKDIPEEERVKENTRARIPNGGLVPVEVPPEDRSVPAAEVAGAEAASSTDGVATSTAETDTTEEVEAEQDGAAEESESTSLEELSAALVGGEAEVE